MEIKVCACASRPLRPLRRRYALASGYGDPAAAAAEGFLSDPPGGPGDAASPDAAARRRRRRFSEASITLPAEMLRSEDSAVAQPPFPAGARRALGGSQSFHSEWRWTQSAGSLRNVLGVGEGNDAVEPEAGAADGLGAVVE